MHGLRIGHYSPLYIEMAIFQWPTIENNGTFSCCSLQDYYQQCAMESLPIFCMN